MDEACKPGARVNDAAGIHATPARAPLGAEVHGVDLAQPLGDAAFARILELFHQHAVIVLRGQRLAGLTAVHDRNFRYSALYPNRAPLTPEQVSKVPPAEHPLVVVHPVTGAPALFVAKDVVSHVVGMESVQGRMLIDELEAFITRPAFVHAHRWSAGDLVVWDNRCTLHRATPYAFDRDTRTLWRTQVRGSMPRAARVADA